MRLTEVAIHNFRGILDGRCTLQDYSLLVGANNAGKSTVVDALRAFYEKGGAKFDKARDFPFVPTTDTESWIELEFLLTPEEVASLAEEYRRPDNLLRVRKKFQTKTKLADNKTSAEGYIFAVGRDGSIGTESFYGAKNVQSGKFGDIVYIPAVSKVDDHTKLSGPSALRDLLSDVLEEVVEDSTAFQSFTTSFGAFAAKIKDEQTPDGRSLRGLESELNRQMGPWGAEFQLKLTAPKTSDIIKSMLSHEFLDKSHGRAQTVDQYGSGFQRQFIFSLIDIASRYGRKKVAKKTKEFSPTLTLILFEEPEAFLHPPQQEVLARALMKVAASTDRQIVCSTHSSHFVSKNGDRIPSLVRLTRASGTVQLFQVAPDVWTRIADANQAVNELLQTAGKTVHPDDLQMEMEAVKHCLWLNPDRCGLFFANLVLLVEGVTEQSFINRLIGDGRLQLPEGGVYVLDCLGKYNIHRFAHLLTALGVPHAIVHDDDGSKNEEHQALNKLIQVCCHKTLTVGLKTISGDLETLLGVPKAGRSDRKPQHVLYHYESQKIDAERVTQFCAVIQELLDAASPPPVAQVEVKTESHAKASTIQ